MRDRVSKPYQNLGSAYPTEEAPCPAPQRGAKSIAGSVWTGNPLDMSVEDIPSDHDFFDPAYVRQWAEQTEIKDPDRLQFFAAFVRRVAELSSTKRRDVVVLELGSGPGRLAHELLTRSPVARYYLLDFSPPMLELAREHIGDDVRAVYVEANFRDPAWTKLIPQRVDVVVTMQALHELRHASRAVALYSQIQDILEPDGLLLVCDHLRPDDDDRALFMTVNEHVAALEAAGILGIEVVHRSDTKALVAGRRAA
jgi:SAM-dependent methyltransferase